MPVSNENGNLDLEGLGLSLLKVMDGPGREVTRTADAVRHEVQEKRLFGLQDPSPWMAYTNLIDFIDLLFQTQQKPSSRFSKPVSPLHFVFM
jgi:hypothetical protein